MYASNRNKKEIIASMQPPIIVLSSSKKTDAILCFYVLPDSAKALGEKINQILIVSLICIAYIAQCLLAL